jgi:gamma-glutamyltranspeptidase / glutathione hydrolase
MFRSSIFAGVAGILVLAGCSLNVGDSLGFGGSAERLAQVVGDEPYAVKTGAAILAQGGTAADAAAAMYFALTVTYPGAAGLGGGGICLVRDVRKNVSEEYVFLPRPVAGNDAFSIPGGVGGFAALHENYGFLPWQKIVSPAESYANTGFPMTHALFARIGDGAKIKADPALAALLLDESGQVRKVGTTIVNHRLAETLAAIRTEGPQTLYTGTVARAIVAFAAAEGHAIPAADLAAYKAEHGTLKVVEVGGNYVFLPSTRSTAGGYLAVLIEALAHTRHVDAAALAEAVKGVRSRLNLAAESETGASGFAALDRNGQSVACAVTLNAPFGSGKTAGDTGVVLAAGGTNSTVYLSPVIVSPSADGPALAVGGAGGPNGAATLADAVVRLGHGETIANRGDLHPLTANPNDAGNVIVCTSDVCTALADPGAAGFGLSVPLPPEKKK